MLGEAVLFERGSGFRGVVSTKPDELTLAMSVVQHAVTQAQAGIAAPGAHRSANDRRADIASFRKDFLARDHSCQRRERLATHELCRGIPAIPPVAHISVMTHLTGFATMRHVCAVTVTRR